MSITPNNPIPSSENAEQSKLDVRKLIEELARKVQDAEQVEADKAKADKHK